MLDYIASCWTADIKTGGLPQFIQVSSLKMMAVLKVQEGGKGESEWSCEKWIQSQGMEAVSKGSALEGAETHSEPRETQAYCCTDVNLEQPIAP